MKICFSERHFGSIVGASGTLIVLGGRDGSATPMALGGMEQWRNGEWHEVNTKMSLERSYQCSTSISRYVLFKHLFKQKINLNS